MNLVTQFGIDPTQIVIEITETVLLNQLKRSKDTLLTLRQHGVRISMDDFGTGHSSLSQLQALPIDQLKIDRSFIMHCHEDYAAHAILTSIISMAHSLSLEVVAEGVETPQQFKALYGAKCDYIQGYLFSKPLSASVMREILEKPLQVNRTWREVISQ